MLYHFSFTCLLISFLMQMMISLYTKIFDVYLVFYLDCIIGCD